uniref:Peptidase S1 domain-containing protein n=1 Tax=Homalodisca liturata TaxID=320908 RepID=A0A1B6IU51_9HEMI
MLGTINPILALQLVVVSCFYHKLLHRLKYEIHPNWRLLPIHDCGVRTVFNGDIGQMMTEDDIAELGQHPWIAAIFVKTNDSVVFECGGSLINARYILTAAHCVYRKHVFKVTLGEHNQSTYVDCNKEKTHCAPPRVNKEVDDVIIHPDYYITKSQFFSRTDIALVRLKRPIDYFTDYIRPICLPTFATYQDFDGRQMEVAGWGTTSSGEDSDTLQSVRVPVVPYKKCFKLWNEAVLERKLCNSDDEEGCQIDFEDNVICAGGVEGKGVSKGYSGGPLITPMRVPGSGHVMFIVGVVSFGVDKFHNLSVPPDVYTRVSQYMMWIMDTIKD